jgi:hypothetical protein
VSFFRRKPQAEIDMTPSNGNRVEIEVHKEAGQEAKKKAVDANKHLKQLLDENGFTLKIYMAAGGKKPKQGVH